MAGARSLETRPVDNLWISMEFGEFNERTYRYDYHASLFLARKSFARPCIVIRRLVIFLNVPQNKKQRKPKEEELYF